MEDVAVKFRIFVALEDGVDYTQLAHFLGLEVFRHVEYQTVAVAKNVG